jgi:hypothetical protein
VHGISAWDYRAVHPEDSSAFDAAMTSISQVVADQVLDLYDFGGFATIVDVAGGRGALLGAILARYPDSHGVLVGPGGRELTEAEFDALLAAAGLQRSLTVPTPTGFAVIEAVVDAGAEGSTP